MNLKRLGYCFIIMVLGVLYFFLLGQPGYILEEDSITFLNANELIAQNYSIYVNFLRIALYLLGEKWGLTVVYLIQSCLALVVSVVVAEYFRKKFSLKYIEAILVFLFTFLPYGYTLPEYVVTHQIMTEGLCYSFFHLFLLFTIIVFLEKKIYMMLPSGIMVLILMKTRSQLLLLSVVYIGLWIIILLQRIYKKIDKRYYTKFWIALGTILIAICILIPITMIEIVKSGNRFQFTAAVSGRVFCVVDKDDREYLSEEYRELFDVIYEEVDKRQQREPYFRADSRRWEDITNSTNENTKLLPTIISRFNNDIDGSLGNVENIRGYLAGTLLKYHILDYFRMTVTLSLQSLVISIFIQPAEIYTLCHVMAFIIYVCAVGLLLYGKYKLVNLKYQIPILVTGVVLLGNILITNIFFFGLQRYVVYCFGFFYISLYLLVKGLFRKGK